MDDVNDDHKLRLLAIYQENLRELELQIANWGMAPPLHLVNEIKHHKQKIEELHDTLRTHSESVKFDEILFNMEDLQNFTTEKVRQAIYDYKILLDEHSLMDKKLALIIFGASVGSYGLSRLYEQMISKSDKPGTITLLLPILGFGASAFYAFRKMNAYGYKWRHKFVDRFGIEYRQLNDR